MLPLCSIVIKSVVLSVSLEQVLTHTGKTTRICKLICEMRELRETIAPVSSPMEYYMILHGNDHNRSAALLFYTKGRTSLVGWMPGNRMWLNISVIQKNLLMVNNVFC